MTEDNLYDVLIIGSGPAGMSAGIYAARSGLSTIVLEQGIAGGQISTSDLVDNYPGIPEISGSDLGQRMAEHAHNAGASSEYGSVSHIHKQESSLFEVVTDMNTYKARTVIVATGASPRNAGFINEDRFKGRGVSYCATCDAAFYKGKQVYVVGGGNTALEEALYLSNIASHVEVIVRKDRVRAHQGLVNKVLAKNNITIRYLTKISKVDGEALITSVTFENSDTKAKETKTFEPGSVGIFVAVGHVPTTDLVSDLVELDSHGYVITDQTLATRTNGLFCAGDMRSGSVKQVITAAADGAIAAMSASAYIEDTLRD